jgi:hypothetical protein
MLPGVFLGQTDEPPGAFRSGRLSLIGWFALDFERVVYPFRVEILLVFVGVFGLQALPETC